MRRGGEVRFEGMEMVMAMEIGWDGMGWHDISTLAGRNGRHGRDGIVGWMLGCGGTGM